MLNILSSWADLWRPDGNAQPQYALAWRRFQADETTAFIEWQADIVRQYTRPDTGRPVQQAAHTTRAQSTVKICVADRSRPRFQAAGRSGGIEVNGCLTHDARIEGAVFRHPLLLLALLTPAHNTLMFVVFAAFGCMAMYVYYSSVYAAIQDVVEPRLRGTAMALYFLAMYVLGASLGPLGTGMASDFFTKRAAAAAGVTVLEPFKGAGLHSAMYLIPALSTLLTLVLFAASRTINRDSRQS